MNITLINKVFFTFLCLVILSACSSTKSVYNKIKPTKYEVPIIENLVDQKIILNSSYSNKTNYENKITLNELKNKNQYQRGVIIIKDKINIIFKKFFFFINQYLIVGYYVYEERLLFYVYFSYHERKAR